MHRVVLSLFVGLLIASCDGFSDSYSSKVARGRTIFLAECASCHGPTGGGTAYGGDLRSKLQLSKGYSYAKFSSVVMSGRRRITPAGVHKAMPRFADRPRVVENLEEIYYYLNEEAWPAGKD